MEELPPCPKCNCEYIYEGENLFICPECNYQWSNQTEEISKEVIIKDALGNILKDGDSVSIIKDIKIKGEPFALKAGTKVKNIHLVEEVDGHNIDAKVPGFGRMMLKSSIVKKSN
jgi:protein PhnA